MYAEQHIPGLSQTLGIPKEELVAVHRDTSRRLWSTDDITLTHVIKNTGHVSYHRRKSIATEDVFKCVEILLGALRGPVSIPGCLRYTLRAQNSPEPAFDIFRETHRLCGCIVGVRDNRATGWKAPWIEVEIFPPLWLDFHALKWIGSCEKHMAFAVASIHEMQAFLGTLAKRYPDAKSVTESLPVVPPKT